MCQDEGTEALSTTPKSLYQQIRTIAEKRYGYQILPKKQVQLKCLESDTNKMSLLRDICKSIGLTLNFRNASNEVKALILTNDM